ncbi:MAG: MBL fold metallo-hydrolase [Candidatus Bathyarchaeota archaeon]|nr:MAG: MBL fold metallo-hydrolase [Candidatus Bathyarchaeota archaeon]
MGFSVKWLGHASFQIKAEGKNIYIDPYEGEYKDKADLVLATHSHHDHCDPSKINKIHEDDTLTIAPEDCVAKIGGRKKTLKPGEKATMGNITVEAVEAYNCKRFRSPGKPFHPKGLGVGYLVTIGDKTVYHAGDTDFIPEMKQLKNIHVALLPSGGTYTMDNEEAAEATLTINPEVAIPMHRWDTDPEDFKENVESKSGIKVVILKPGEQIKVQ